MSINRDLHRIISEHSHADLQVLIQYLGEACEIRQPIYPKEANPSSVFANPKRFQDEIEYGEALTATVLMIPPQAEGGMGKTATDELEPSTNRSMDPSEPMRALFLGAEPQERAMITVRRHDDQSRDKHYYVLQRSLINQQEPRILQCFLIPVWLDDLLDEDDSTPESSTPDEPITLTEG